MYADLALRTTVKSDASAGYILVAEKADAYKAGTLASDGGNDTG
ncbi:MAG: hypothetical protein AAGH38_06120 [Pseudomonadota bacterium]